MDPDDRVLVGVINRRRDFEILRRDCWYRIPILAAPLCIDAEILAFYLSRTTRLEDCGSIPFFARRTGFELWRRLDLLPAEMDHPRAHELYFKIQFRELERCPSPIANPSRRVISFIYTTWELFEAARTIGDLYLHERHLDD